jgi:hypothetical protein
VPAKKECLFMDIYKRHKSYVVEMIFAIIYITIVRVIVWVFISIGLAEEKYSNYGIFLKKIHKM